MSKRNRRREKKYQQAQAAKRAQDARSRNAAPPSPDAPRFTAEERAAAEAEFEALLAQREGRGLASEDFRILGSSHDQ